MAIDPSIIMGVKPVQLANPLEQYMQAQQIQGAQNQNRLADLMYSEKQRDLAADKVQADALAGAQDVGEALAKAGYGARALAYRKTKLEADAKQADIGKTQAETQAKQIETLTKANGMIGSAAGAIVQNPTYDNAVAMVGGLRQQLGDDLSKRLGLDTLEIPKDPAQLKAWAQNHYLGSIDTAKQLEDARIKSEGLANRGSQEKIAAGHDSTSRANTAATVAATRRGQDMTDARAREQNTLAREAQQTQVVVDPNQGPLLINKGTKTAVPATFADGTRVPGENAVAARKLNDQLKAGIASARELIPKATASGAGAMLDNAAAFFGKSTEGADAAAQLDTIAGWMTSNVPRMQGPQSDKDVLLYKQMAGDVANRNLPVSRRLASLDGLEKLLGKYADINQAGTPAPAAAPAAAGAVPADIAALLKKHGGK